MTLGICSRYESTFSVPGYICFGFMHLIDRVYIKKHPGYSMHTVPSEYRGGLHRHSGRDGFATRKVHVSACISAVVTTKSFSVPKYRRWPTSTGAIASATCLSHDHAGQVALSGRVVSHGLLISVLRYGFTVPMYCMGVGEHIIRCIHHLNTAVSEFLISIYFAQPRITAVRYSTQYPPAQEEGAQ